jgi:hypothetical protein
MPVAGTTPDTSPRVVFFPCGETRMIFAVLRSETRAFPSARKTRPQGTSKSSATVPARSGFGGPVGVGDGVADAVVVRLVLGLGELLGRGEALADGEEPGFDGPVAGPGDTSSAPQPATVARASPEEAYRNCRLVTTQPIVPTGAVRPAMPSTRLQVRAVSVG